MQQHERASSSYALPYTAHVRFWKLAVWPLLCLVAFVVGPVVVVPPPAESRWQAYAVAGLVAVPLLYLLGWVASRRIVLSHDDISTRALLTRTRAIRYTDIRSVKLRVTQLHDGTSSRLIRRYQLSITSKTGPVIRIPIQSYHRRDMRVVVDAIVMHTPHVALDSSTRQLLAGQLVLQP